MTNAKIKLNDGDEFEIKNLKSIDYYTVNFVINRESIDKSDLKTFSLSLADETKDIKFIGDKILNARTDTIVSVLFTD